MANNELFESIYKTHYDEIYKYVFYYTKQRDLAEDVVQECFFRVFNNLDKFDNKNTRAWIYRIAKNILIDDSKKFENKNVLKSSEFTSTVGMETSLDKEIENRDFYQIILTKMDALTPEQKEAILLRYIEDLEYSEIALIMEKTKEAVMILVSKGLKTLRINSEEEKKLFKMGFIFADLSLDKNFEEIRKNIFNNSLNQMPNMTPVGAATTISKAAIFKIATAATVLAIAGGTGAVLLTSKSNSTNTNQNSNQIVTTATPVVTQIPTSIPVITPTVSSVTSTPTSIITPAPALSYKDQMINLVSQNKSWNNETSQTADLDYLRCSDGSHTTRQANSVLTMQISSDQSTNQTLFVNLRDTLLTTNGFVKCNDLSGASSPIFVYKKDNKFISIQLSTASAAGPASDNYVKVIFDY
jgi:RNA polymerase sigma-70 factor, ECF subfamily